MLGRLLIVIAMMLTGPLFIEVYLYHPMIVREHDLATMIPMVISPLVLFGGFLLLAADRRPTAALFALACAAAVITGVVGTAIHVAMHTESLLRLVTDAQVWRGQPPILVPLSYAAAGCLGFIALAMPRTAPPAPGRLLEALAASCGLAATVAGAVVDGGTVALFAVIAALGLGALGYLTELAALVDWTVFPPAIKKG